MIKIKAADWHINQKRVPTTDSDEYEKYFDEQEVLCLEGCTVDGIFIPGYLYYHLNFWNVDVDYVDEKGRVQQKYSQPLLRDNEWMIFNAIERAEKEMKGLAIGGSRRISKTSFITSYISHGATFDQDSQNIIAGLNAPDIKNVTDKIDKGMGRLPEAWQLMRIEENWKQQVTFGVKERNGRKYPYSSIIMRNLDDGNNVEAIAGTKPRKLIIDEFAKSNGGLAALEAAKPGFTTMYGWTCSPIITFTGGDIEKYQDAQKLFENPDSFNFISFPHEKKPGKVHGLYMGAKYRLEGKVESNLAEYLNLPKAKELAKFPMLVADEEKALRVTNEELEKIRQSGDRELYLKTVMYFPKEVEDIFATTGKDFFKTAPIKRQIQKIEDEGIKGSYVELFHDGEKITWKHSEKMPVTEYPVKTQSTDCPIIIYEHPVMDNPPWALYVGGGDTYIQDGTSEYSDSLGTFYILKRIYNAANDRFQNQIVAAFASRPDDKEFWNEQVRFLIKYYNAYSMIENDELSFINYMKNKQEALKYLAPEPAWVKQVTQYGKQDRAFGMSRASERTRNHLNGLTRKYLDEVIHVEQLADGTTGRETLGVARIFDKMLLEEMKGYDGKVNADRIVAFQMCLALADDLEISVGTPSSSESDPRLTSYHKKAGKKRSLFGQTNKLFNANYKK